ncbi:oxidoreductase-like protein [Stachybotrys elegans]|uniref:Oxidoreductase-like protein n=1 Tax=Stachybotrys elegans TaxID=80388 RepID=A0A8K0SPM2_9HYPO|nr:oxidoreductase-like protein [Stachybotrys elegans]
MSVARVATRARAALPFCRRCFASTSTSAAEVQWPQRTPLGAYYDSIIKNPSPYPYDKKPETPPTTANVDAPPAEKKPAKRKPGRKPKSETSAATTTPSEPIETTPTDSQSPLGQLRRRRAEYLEHGSSKQAQSTYVAGVYIPPKPEEPDNCCMSGCVNCVWDRYREDFEEWTAQTKEAEARLAQAKSDKSAAKAPSPVSAEPSAASKDMWDESAFQGVPVGIREFMRLEKQLKKRHGEESTLGG